MRERVEEERICLGVPHESLPQELGAEDQPSQELTMQSPAELYKRCILLGSIDSVVKVEVELGLISVIDAILLASLWGSFPAIHMIIKISWKKSCS